MLFRSGTPDLKKLVRVAKSNAKAKECPRDHPQFDVTWHFMRYIPEVTACPSCFDSLIKPVLRSGSDVAQEFNVKPAILPAGFATMHGASCQLYSPRMQRVFERAVKKGGNEGITYLQRKVHERKVKETYLRGEQEKIGRALERVRDRTGARAAADKAYYKRELDEIALEWADWE